MMRRSFLKWLGIAPAVPAMAKMGKPNYPTDSEWQEAYENAKPVGPRPTKVRNLWKEKLVEQEPIVLDSDGKICEETKITVEDDPYHGGNITYYVGTTHPKSTYE